MKESDTAHELVRVAGNGRLDTLKRLRDAGADAQGVGKLYPACVATDRRQVDCLRLMPELVNDPDTTNTCHETAWHEAAHRGQLGCARLLRVHGAKEPASNTVA